jgi:hypothetical protein
VMDDGHVLYTLALLFPVLDASARFDDSVARSFKFKTLLTNYFLVEQVELGDGPCSQCPCSRVSDASMRPTHSQRQAVLTTTPEFLVIGLQRVDSQLNKLHWGVEDYTQDIDFGSFTRSKVPVLYELVRVVSHRGLTFQNGHYVVHVRISGGRWILLDDTDTMNRRGVVVQGVGSAQAIPRTHSHGADPGTELFMLLFRRKEPCVPVGVVPRPVGRCCQDAPSAHLSWSSMNKCLLASMIPDEGGFRY